MKTSLLLAFSLALTPMLRAEGPADDVKAAAKKLSESANYTWTVTTPPPPDGGGGGGGGGRGFGGGATEGKVEKGGPALVTRKFGENTMESVYKAGKVALKTQEGWKSGEELAAEGDTGGGGGGRGRGGAWAARMAETFKAPAEEATALAEGIKEIKKDGDAYTGDLTEEAAKQRLAFGGRRPGGDGGNNAGPTNVKGSAKFWIKDGVLAKYEVTVSGTREGDNGPREMKRTSTTEIKDVGSTKVEIPAEATAKLPAAKTEEKKTEEKKPDAK